MLFLVAVKLVGVVPVMECRVLSIQSHVVRGYVGNKSATFPLQVRTTSYVEVAVVNVLAEATRKTKTA